MKTASTNCGTTPTTVAVVGHTNTGKTSLIRTLLRDERFGEIRDAAGTTRHVEKSAIWVGEEQILTIFDTPGFEDSSALLQVLDTVAAASQHASSTELLRDFVERSSDYPEFEQEIKVLRQTLGSDILLYIIDVREPILGKYQDEVEILSKAGKPIIPVFNFTADNGDALARWRQQMAEFNLHAALEFDTVAFEF
jgi:small GTP-binding protein